MCFAGSSIPSNPLPQPAPQQADAAVTAASDAEKRRRRMAASNTILTSPLGVTGSQATKTQPKTLLGV